MAGLLEKLSGGRLGRFQQDVAWNITSFAVIGLCGIVMNVLIGVFYGRAALGVFNQVFAVYIFFSQFAALGIHYSVLKRVAEHMDDRNASSAIIAGALAPTFLVSAAATAVLFLARHYIGGLLESPEVGVGIAYAAVGMFLFAVNKALLAAINGLRWMRSFAVLQALRPICMLGALVAACYLRLSVGALPVVLSVAEGVIFLAAAALLLGRGYLRGGLARTPVWTRRHLRFGIRSFGSGVLTELNTRVDVLMLGYFKDDAMVGVYSFAAILAEGVFQILVVLRNNYNPLLAQSLKARDYEGLSQLIRRGKRLTYLAMLLIGLAAVLLYPLGLQLIGQQAKFMSAWPLFGILIAGIVITSGYMPFSFILLQAGRPATHTLLALGVVAFNIAANAVLIPLLAAYGAALATALALVAQAAGLALLTRLKARVRL